MKNVKGMFLGILFLIVAAVGTVSVPQPAEASKFLEDMIRIWVSWLGYKVPDYYA